MSTPWRPSRSTTASPASRTRTSTRSAWSEAAQPVPGALAVSLAGREMHDIKLPACGDGVGGDSVGDDAAVALRGIALEAQQAGALRLCQLGGARKVSNRFGARHLRGEDAGEGLAVAAARGIDRKSTRLNSSN